MFREKKFKEAASKGVNQRKHLRRPRKISESKEAPPEEVLTPCPGRESHPTGGDRVRVLRATVLSHEVEVNRVYIGYIALCISIYRVHCTCITRSILRVLQVESFDSVWSFLYICVCAKCAYTCIYAHTHTRTHTHMHIHTIAKCCNQG